MSTKRQEERNEKVIRGLMKLPPNRRCINCNSLGPQYVCTNFWTFVCMTCSGIHREFTHRVKSVSMAKFTSQEVDSLQNGGNQRARELYLQAWDPDRDRLPNNSNVEKVREFIKNVYVNRKYSVDNSAVRPPKDPQGLRNREDEKRRASSYHSYSQSPPYDFEYEERRYGKHAPTLTRPGSDRALYDGKLSSFLSPSRFSDHANDERFGDEGSYRASDFSVSSGGDPFRADTLSPNSQRDTASTFSSMNNGGRPSHSQRTGSGSFGSFDSNSVSFKSVNSAGSPEISLEPERGIDISGKSSSLSSHVQSSVPGTFGGLDLFDAPFAPQNVTSQLPVGNNPQLLDSSLTHPVDLFQQNPNPSISTSSSQQSSQAPLPSLFDLFSPQAQQQSVASSDEKISNEVLPNDGGWATFDMSQNSAPVGNESAAPAVVPALDRSTSGNVNPFSFDQSLSDSAGSEPAASSTSFWYGGLQNAETATSTVPIWNAFENSADQHHVPVGPQNNEQVSEHYNSNADKFPGFAVLEGLYNAGNVERPLENGTPASGVASHINVALHDFSMVSAVAGSRIIASDHKSGNPFDVPYDSDMESGNNMPHDFWNMSSLQAALPNQNSAPYVTDVNQSWFPQNPAQSYIPGTFDHPTGHLGLMASQQPNTNIVNIPAQGPVAASVGGNPFA